MWMGRDRRAILPDARIARRIARLFKPACHASFSAFGAQEPHHATPGFGWERPSNIPTEMPLPLGRPQR